MPIANRKTMKNNFNIKFKWIFYLACRKYKWLGLLILLIWVLIFWLITLTPIKYGLIGIILLILNIILLGYLSNIHHSLSKEILTENLEWIDDSYKKI